MNYNVESPNITLSAVNQRLNTKQRKKKTSLEAVQVVFTPSDFLIQGAIINVESNPKNEFLRDK
jgi:hypothetical protein